MANYENDWNRNRRGFNQEWDNDRNRFDRNRNFDEDRYEDRYNDNDRRNRDRNFGNQGNYGTSDNDYNSERNRGDIEWSGRRDIYGNSGLNRSSNYSGRGDDWSNDWNNRGNRGYQGSNYGYDRDRFRNERNYNEGDRNWWDKTKDEVSSWFGDEDAERRRRRDEMQQGQHKGKGPKGYTRSDERIKDDVNDRLSDDPHVDASDIEVSVDNGEVTLTGTVNNRWEKRHAEDIVESISGVKNVENRLKVSSNTTNTGTSGTGSGSYGVPYGSSGAAPVGAFDISKS